MLAVSGCAVWKKSLSANGDIYVAINNCIIDFINTSNLFKADSIFAIDIIENEDIYVIGTFEIQLELKTIFSPINT